MSIVEGIKIGEEIRQFLAELSGNRVGIQFQVATAGRLAYTVDGFSIIVDVYYTEPGAVGFSKVLVLSSTNLDLEDRMLPLFIFAPLNTGIRRDIAAFYAEHQKLQTAIVSRGDVN